MATEKKMKKKNNNNCNKDIPQELMLEILLRLPVKSLLRFKCVSRPWLSIISSYGFAKSHFELSATPNHKLLCYDDSELGSIDPNALFNDHPAPVKLICPHPTPVYANIQGSCRGFIMLRQYPDLIIWNPSTGVHKRISYSHIAPCLNGHNGGDDSLLYGFGYDASKDDYLLVIAWSNDSGQNFLEYFSVRNNKWENFEVTHLRADMDGAISPGFYLNGTIHWDAFSDYILAFDMIERKFFKIPLPLPLAQAVMTCCLELLGGFLSVSVWTPNNETEIWVMKEYKVQSSWTMYKISDSTFDPIYFTIGCEIIGFNCHGGLVKYNDKGELLEHSPSCHYDYHYWMYTESLLSLPSDSGVARV